MLANFLNLAFKSSPSEITFLLGFVEATALELEPFLLDSLTADGFDCPKDSASVE